MKFIPVIVWALLILLLSVLPPASFPEVQLFPGADKVVHFIMYAALSFLLIMGIVRTKPMRWQAFITIFASGFYGVFMETLQYSLYTGRSAEPGDITANFCGAVFGYFVFRVWMKQRRD